MKSGPGIVIFLGPPGAGKGTQASRVATRLRVPHVSTGDLFRHHLKQGTPIGQLAKGFMDRGALVPDEVVCSMVEDRLGQPDAKGGCILDGFPRTIPQAEALEKLLARLGRGTTTVVSFDLASSVLEERIGGRLTCKGCGASFHATLNPPKVAGICDACGKAELHVRADDRPESVRARMTEYAQKTAPLLDFYGSRGALHRVDAGRRIGEIEKDLEVLLDRP
jgi:adenylate kinase